MAFIRQLGIQQNRWRRRLVLGVPYTAIALISAVVGYQTISSSSAQATLLSGQVELTTSKQTYVIGDDVRFTLTNHLQNTVYIANHCPGEPLEVYRLQAGNWQRIHDSADPAKCIDAPRSYSVVANAQVGASYRYWPHLFDQPGSYRLVAPVDGYTDSPSVDFTITTP